MWCNNKAMSSVALCFCCVFGSYLIIILNGMQIKLTDIFILFLSDSRQILWQYLQLGQNHFLTHASLFFSRSLICATDIKRRAENIKKYILDARQKIIQIQMTLMSHSDTSPTHNIIPSFSSSVWFFTNLISCTTQPLQVMGLCNYSDT